MNETDTAAKPSTARPVWLVRAGKHGEDEDAALKNGLAIIGFTEVPDLTPARTFDEALAIVRRALPDAADKRIRNLASQLDMFARRIQVGDIIALPLKTQPGRIALGEVSSAYAFKMLGGTPRHTRGVRWLRQDAPRSAIEQDLLYSLGAFLTVCRITRNDAERRIATVLQGRRDPGPVQGAGVEAKEAAEIEPAEALTAPVDLAQIAHDQVLAQIRSRFAGHGLARLVAAILEADGFVAKTSPPGSDGGVDILAGRGPLGFDSPRLCVQVKSSDAPEDVTVLRALQGTMQAFGADQGLLVSWGGFKRSVEQEARQGFFTVRLWSASDLVDALYRTYDKLPEEIQAELPLKRAWVLVLEGEAD